MQLEEFLREWAAKPFVRGETDCGIFVADWIRERRGADPAGDLRGATNDRGAARRIIRAGGYEAMVTNALDAFGLARVDEARPGDVALLVRPGDFVAVGIKTTTAWAVKEMGGLMIGQFHPVTIWRV